MFYQASPVEYDSLLADLCTTWDARFEKYYVTSIHPQVILDNYFLIIVILFFFVIGESALGHWVLNKLHCYNPYSGITNNASESLNKVIKDLQQWKEAPVDCMVLVLYQLQAYYLSEVSRGIAGVGEYTLRECYFSLRSSIVEYIPSKSLEEIMTTIKEGASVSTEECHVHVPGGEEDEVEPPADLTRKLSSHARACLLLKLGFRNDFV